MDPLTPSLTASGGWCAPSDQIYGLLPIDLPDVQVSRGGIQFTPSPYLQAAFDSWDDDGPSMACTDSACTNHNTIPTDAASAARPSL